MSLLASWVDEIVNVKLVVPVSPSSSETSSIANDATSSFRMVPTPCASTKLTRLVSTTPSNRPSLRLTAKVSFNSTIESVRTETVVVVVSDPAVIVAS